MAIIQPLGHVEWVKRFDDALKRYRESEPDSIVRDAAARDLKALQLSEGDILYWAARKPH